MMYIKQTPVMRSPGSSLDDLLASRFLPRQWANRIWSPHELPSRLEQCARNLAPDSEWRAYGGEEQIFFAIARAHSPEMPNDSPDAIDVYFLDRNASVYSAGVWDFDSKHGWWLDSVLDLSYDCDHGWWLDGAMDMHGTMDRHGPTATTHAVSFPRNPLPLRLAAAAAPQRKARRPRA